MSAVFQGRSRDVFQVAGRQDATMGAFAIVLLRCFISKIVSKFAWLYFLWCWLFQVIFQVKIRDLVAVCGVTFQSAQVCLEM